MPNTKLTKSSLSNHFDYGKKVYIAIALVTWLLADLLFSTTEYRPPNERNVDIQLVGAYADTEGLVETAAVALEAGQAYERKQAEEAGIIGEGDAYDTPLQTVSFYSLMYDTANTEDVYGVQKYMVTLAAQEGDIYIVNRVLLDDLVLQGVAVPLDPYIDAGILDPGDRDLSRVTFDEPIENEGETPSGNRHIYALQADSLYRMLDEDIGYFTLDKYMLITTFSKNQETSAAVMQSLIDQLTTEKPPHVEAYEKSLAEINDNPFNVPDEETTPPPE